MEEFLNYCGVLKKNSEPLFKYLPIRHFNYIEARPGKDFIALSSDLDLFNAYLQRAYYQRTPYHTLLEFCKSGIYCTDLYAFPELPPVQDHSQLLADFDYGHSCMIMHKETKNGELVAKIYAFEGRLSDPYLNHIYLNNIDLLHKFTRYIDQKIYPIKKALQPDYYPVQEEMHFYKEIEPTDAITNKANLLSLFKSTDMTGPKPTAREMEIIMWNLKGKTAEETASIMGISRRTVEKHFEKLRKKFGCYSKAQIALQMARYIDS